MFGIDGTGEIIKDVGGVMVSVFTSSAVDRGYKPQSSETKHYKIGMCCFSVKDSALK